MKRVRSHFVLGAWTAGLVTSLLVLTNAGSGSLALPAGHASAIHEWLRTTDTTVIVLALVRLAALAGAWYLLATTALSAIAQLLRWRPLLTIADLVSVPTIRRLTQQAAGIGLAGALALPTAASAVAAPAGATSDVPVMRHLSPGEQVIKPTTTIAAPVESSPATDARQDERPAMRTIKTGENFWLIAQSALRDAWGRQPTDAELTGYWRTIVQQNGALLRHSGNPDLVFAGDVIVLPPPPAPKRQ